MQQEERQLTGTIVAVFPNKDTLCGYISADEDLGKKKFHNHLYHLTKLLCAGYQNKTNNYFFHLARLRPVISVNEGRNLKGRRVSFISYFENNKRNADSVVLINEYPNILLPITLLHWLLQDLTTVPSTLNLSPRLLIQER
jgi:hypothetical protein